MREGGARLPRLGRIDDPLPHARLLSNGAYTVVFTGAGTGFSTYRGVALTHWHADRTLDGLGFFVYLRDLDHDVTWSAGHQPTRSAPDSYEATSGAGSMTIRRLDHQIESTLAVCVDPAR